MEVLCYLNEIWKDVPGYFGLYQVSNYGRVRSLGFDKWHPGRILKPGKDKDGYYFFYLTKNKAKKFYRCNRLVWETFNGPIPEGMQVNHINECRWDNRLENLSLTTPKENCNWGARNRRISETQTNRADQSKWVIQLSKDNEILHFYKSTMQVEREYSFRNTHVSACCLGKQKTAYGFIWKYAE